MPSTTWDWPWATCRCRRQRRGCSCIKWREFCPMWPGRPLAFRTAAKRWPAWRSDTSATRRRCRRNYANAKPSPRIANRCRRLCLAGRGEKRRGCWRKSDLNQVALSLRERIAIAPSKTLAYPLAEREGYLITALFCHLVIHFVFFRGLGRLWRLRWSRRLWRRRDCGRSWQRRLDQVSQGPAVGRSAGHRLARNQSDNLRDRALCVGSGRDHELVAVYLHFQHFGRGICFEERLQGPGLIGGQRVGHARQVDGVGIVANGAINLSQRVSRLLGPHDAPLEVLHGLDFPFLAVGIFGRTDDDSLLDVLHLDLGNDLVFDDDLLVFRNFNFLAAAQRLNLLEQGLQASFQFGQLLVGLALDDPPLGRPGLFGLVLGQGEAGQGQERHHQQRAHD